MAGLLFMNEITSVQNNLVKETVKLHQKKYREDLILLEGLKAVEGAILSNLKIILSPFNIKRGTVCHTLT